jgi:RNA polymerase sigma factor (sigma-70 family)
MTEPVSTVSIVDDDEGVRKALSRLLTAHGYTVRTYSSAEDFLKQGEDHSGCLVLDLQMPGVNGLALQRELAKRGMILPVIFVTAHGDIAKSVAAMKQGAVDFLEKPLEEEDLLQAVETAFRRDHLERDEHEQRELIVKRLARLTPRERQIMEHVASGDPNKRIAVKLGLSEKTVKTHRARVMHKMEAQSVAELVRMVTQIDL